MDKLEYVEKAKELAGKLNCYVKEDLIKNLLDILLLAEDAAEEEEIRSDIDALLGLHLPKLVFSKRPMLPSPTSEEAGGELVMGQVTQGDRIIHPFGLSLNELTRHLGIYGQTGHGKTTLLYTIMGQLIQLKIPFLYLDLKKDGRCLLRQHPKLLVIPWRELRWNPLRAPPGMDVKSWWQLFAEVCGHCWGVYHAGVNYILEYLDQLYEKWERRWKFPTLTDLYKLMLGTQEITRKRLEYFDVMYNRVRALVSILGSVIDVDVGLKLEELLNHPVVIELDQLRADEQNWVSEVILAWIYAYRLVQGHRSEQLRHCIIVDEAHRIFDANKEYRETTREMGMPTINLFPTQFRDFGESLIVSSQEPSKVADSIHANTLVKLVGNLGSGKDINAISEAMALTEEERDCISELQRGEWLVKMSDRYTKPFTITSLPHHVDKDVSDEEVLERAKPFLSSFCEKNKEPEKRGEITEERFLAISEDCHKLLENINSHPFLGIVGRQKELGISAGRLQRAKEELISKGLVKQVDVSLSRRPTSFLVLTEKALQLLESKGLNTGLWRHVGNVGFEHVLYQVLIRWQFKALGYDARIEAKISEERRIDVLAVKDGRRVGVEVELNANIDLRQKLNGIESLDKLYIVTSKHMLSEVEDKLGTLPSKVEVCSIDRLLEGLCNLYGNKARIKPSEQKRAESNLSRQNNSGISSSNKSEVGGKGVE